jgi:hypothetical protein
MNTAKFIANGKEYSLLFGYTCHKIFQRGIWEHQKSFWPGEKGITPEGLAYLIHAAYIASCLNNNISEELSFDEVYEAIDNLCTTEDGLKQVSGYYDIYLKSKEMAKLSEEAEKKSQSNGSLPSQTLMT